jgi:hypothetical protein
MSSERGWNRCCLLAVANTPTRSGRPSAWTKRQLIDGIRWRVRVRAARPSSRPSWTASTSRTSAQAGPAHGPTRSGQTRPTAPAPTTPTCDAASPAPSRTSRPTTTPQNRGRRGGRPPRFSPGDYRARHSVECGIKPTQTTPRRRRQIRQSRRPIRSHPPHRRHKRLAPDLTLRQALNLDVEVNQCEVARSGKVCDVAETQRDDLRVGGYEVDICHVVLETGLCAVASRESIQSRTSLTT